MSVTAKQTAASMASDLTRIWWDRVQNSGIGLRRQQFYCAIEEAVELGMELERKRIAAAIEESDIKGKLEKFLHLCRQRNSFAA